MHRLRFRRKLRLRLREGFGLGFEVRLRLGLGYRLVFHMLMLRARIWSRVHGRLKQRLKLGIGIVGVG